MNQHKKLA